MLCYETYISCLNKKWHLEILRIKRVYYCYAGTAVDIKAYKTFVPKPSSVEPGSQHNVKTLSDRVETNISTQITNRYLPGSYPGNPREDIQNDNLSDYKFEVGGLPGSYPGFVDLGTQIPSQMKTVSINKHLSRLDDHSYRKSKNGKYTQVTLRMLITH